jgi:hypothetical protein
MIATRHASPIAHHEFNSHWFIVDTKIYEIQASRLDVKTKHIEQTTNEEYNYLPP